MSNEAPSPSERDVRIYLADMLEFSESVLVYTAGHDLESLGSDAMRLDATLRKLSPIGEAAMRVPDDIRALAPSIPWRKIVATRNRLMHAYKGTEMSARLEHRVGGCASAARGLAGAVATRVSPARRTRTPVLYPSSFF